MWRGQNKRREIQPLPDVGYEGEPSDNRDPGVSNR